MYEILNNFLLAGDKFMREMYFKTTWTYLLFLWNIHKKQRKNAKL